MTGTTMSAWTRCSAIVSRIRFGSNFGSRTSVVESVRPRLKCARPQEWNIGAAMSVRCRARRGIMSRSAAAGSSDDGWWRPAPFGVPVVPLVRMTTRPGRLGRVERPLVAVRRDRLGPHDVLPAALGGVRDEVGELGVVGDRDRALRAADVGAPAARRRRC